MMAIAWNKIVAIKFNYVGSKLLVTQVVTEHGAVIETDIPYEEAVTKWREAQKPVGEPTPEPACGCLGCRQWERELEEARENARRAQQEPPQRDFPIGSWWKATESIIQERDALKRSNEELATELGWEKGINRNLLAELKAMQDTANNQNVTKDFLSSEQVRLVRERDAEREGRLKAESLLADARRDLANERAWGLWRQEREAKEKAWATISEQRDQIAQINAELAQAKKDLIDAEIQHRRNRDAY
jgi:hypothetical protein